MSLSQPNTQDQLSPRAALYGRRLTEARRLAALPPDGAERYCRLGELRAQLAREAGIPAYQVLSNEQLLLLCEAPARTQAELEALPGMNKVRLRAFGTEILEAMTEAPPQQA